MKRILYTAAAFIYLPLFFWLGGYDEFFHRDPNNAFLLFVCVAQAGMTWGYLGWREQP